MFHSNQILVPLSESLNNQPGFLSFNGTIGVVFGFKNKHTINRDFAKG